MQTNAQASRSASSTAGMNGANKSTGRQAQPSDMSIQVSGKHMAVGDALRSRIEEELATSVGRYFERGGSGDVVLYMPGGAYDLRVETGSGDESYRGVIDDDAAASVVEITTGSGDVTVRGR